MSVHDYSEGGIPKTIEELKDYCDRNGFTSSKTRFFVGFNYQGPKAFGIYKDEATGEFVVYKNKADGTRAVRYRGNDEEFAVVELYDRLQSEIANQKLNYAADMAARERNKYEEADAYSSIKNFNINDYPLKSDYSSMPEGSSYLGGYGNEGGSGGKNPLGLVIGFIAMILSLLFGLAGVGGGGGGGYRSGYNSGYSSSYDYDYDSGWSSDSWDSGYTDWDSDW
ncbi:MAG: hypothetical protein J6M44_00690 [Butyrivibrio sp.]|uniref:hypothetical protein n=1 Tax=Butyrivibrio sp. TaxID=28121 RepID=UPI001B52A9D9|nr:hypothetical protein [Butyrivibrio sp.]MBP3277449.1 hypothetical protein [Butyrivibrio sp.]MBP3783404.1 hypothetical protein [Butyrivibrio sp.]